MIYSKQRETQNAFQENSESGEKWLTNINKPCYVKHITDKDQMLTSPIIFAFY